MLNYLTTLLISVANAQTGGRTGVEVFNPLRAQNVSDIITIVANYLFGIGGAVATVMVLVGAFQILTAAGDPKKFGDGKKTIIYAAIGYAILLLSGGVASLVANVLGGTSGENTTPPPSSSSLSFPPIPESPINTSPNPTFFQ